MRALATRYECVLRDNPLAGLRHHAGAGKPTRKRCGCGGALIVRSGWWGVFRWTGAGQYPRKDALSLHLTECAAETAAARVDPAGETTAVRWVPAYLALDDRPVRAAAIAVRYQLF